MSFSMIDRIVDWEKEKWIEAVKTLSPREEYLADHFPSFPVMPGVLMLEAMVQAAAWLLRLGDGHLDNIFLLREVRAIRYGSFVRPGDVLQVRAELIKDRGGTFSFKGRGAVGDMNAVTGRFTLIQKQLRELGPLSDKVRERIESFFREWGVALTG